MVWPADEDTTYNTSTSTPATPSTSTPVTSSPEQAPSSPQAPPSGPVTRSRARELNFVMMLKNEGPEGGLVCGRLGLAQQRAPRAAPPHAGC